MVRPNWKHVVMGVVVVAMLVAAASQADACWGCGRAYYAYYSYSPGWSCGSCWGGWYGGWGCCGARRGCGYRACYSPCTSCCYTSACCDSGSVSCCGGTSTPSQGAPRTSPTPAPPQPQAAPEKGMVEPPAAGAMPGASAVPTRENSGLLTIYVPYAAKVFINDHQTTTAGSRRKFVSNGLQSGLTYKYVIRAEIVRDGKLIDETKTVYLTAGAVEGVAFGFNPAPAAGLASAQ